MNGKLYLLLGAENHDGSVYAFKVVNQSNAIIKMVYDDIKNDATPNPPIDADIIGIVKNFLTSDYYFIQMTKEIGTSLQTYNLEIINLKKEIMKYQEIVYKCNLLYVQTVFYNLFITNAISKNILAQELMVYNLINIGNCQYYLNIINIILKKINANNISPSEQYFQKYHYIMLINYQLLFKYIILRKKDNKMKYIRPFDSDIKNSATTDYIPTIYNEIESNVDVHNCRGKIKEMLFAFNTFKDLLDAYRSRNLTSVSVYIRINDWGSVGSEVFTRDLTNPQQMNVSIDTCKDEDNRRGIIPRQKTIDFSNVLYKNIKTVKVEEVYDTGNFKDNGVISKYMSLPVQLSQKKGIMMVTYGYSGTGKTFSLFGSSSAQGLLQTTLLEIRGQKKIFFRLYEIYAMGVQYNFYWKDLDKIFQRVYTYTLQTTEDNELEVVKVEEKANLGDINEFIGKVKDFYPSQFVTIELPDNFSDDGKKRNDISNIVDTKDGKVTIKYVNTGIEDIIVELKDKSPIINIVDNKNGTATINYGKARKNSTKFNSEKVDTYQEINYSIFKNFSKFTDIIDNIRAKNEESPVNQPNFPQRIKPTTNNPVSSRSILIYDFQIMLSDDSVVPFVIVDLPGKENIVESYIRNEDYAVENDTKVDPLIAASLLLNPILSPLLKISYTNIIQKFISTQFDKNAQSIIDKWMAQHIITTYKNRPPTKVPISQYIDLVSKRLTSLARIDWKSSDKFNTYLGPGPVKGDIQRYNNVYVYFISTLIKEGRIDLLVKLITELVETDNGNITNILDKADGRATINYTDSSKVTFELPLGINKPPISQIEDNKNGTATIIYTDNSQVIINLPKTGIKNYDGYDNLEEKIRLPYEGVAINENILGLLWTMISRIKVNDDEYKNPASEIKIQVDKSDLSLGFGNHDRRKMDKAHAGITMEGPNGLSWLIENEADIMTRLARRANHNIYQEMDMSGNPHLTESSDVDYKQTIDNLYQKSVQTYDPERIYSAISTNDTPTFRLSKKKTHPKKPLIHQMLLPYIGESKEDAIIDNIYIFYLLTNNDANTKCKNQIDLLVGAEKFLKALEP